MNNEFLDIKITKKTHNAIDEAIDKGIEKAYMEIKSKKSKRRKKSIAITAACFALIFTLGITNPALAAKLPIIGSVFQAIERNIYFPGNYSQYATAVNEVVSSNGINVTLSDILCDGEGLYVTYIIESEEPFKYTSWDDEPLTMNQLLTGADYNKVSFSDKQLDNSGFAGLEGKFIDENTFIGMERYNLLSLDAEIPNEFDFEVKLKAIGNHGLTENDKSQNFYGTWEFKVPVKVDKSISKNIEINYEGDNGFSLDSIIITPFNVVIKSTNPDPFYYGIKIIDENNNELTAHQGNILDDNRQISYFSALSKESKNIRIIIYRDILEEKEVTKYPDGSYTTNYEDLGDEVLLDKTINID